MPSLAPRCDLFAAIAADATRQPQPASLRRETLIEPGPPELPPRSLPAASADLNAAFTPPPKLDNAEKLAAALADLRAQMTPFLRELAPPLPQTRVRVPLEEFDWRVQTAADQADFANVLAGRGAWERVRIPHYGGPLGRATTLYRTVFSVSEAMLARGAIFLCCQGIDYRAHLFLNGAYLGAHEGFFAPFAFDGTASARVGDNVLVVRVENDAICMGNDSWGADGHLYEGDKLYAATGPGYDDPEVGWHHCPPGMGIYQDIFVEARAPLHIHDIFVRPLLAEEAAEAWIEVYNCDRLRRPCRIELSLYGHNFEETVFVDQPYALAGPAGPGINYYRLPIAIPRPRVWDLDAPWLYQLQVRLLSDAGEVLDVGTRAFGMRSFTMDETGDPKGMFYLNGRPIRLRGANGMGHMQQCVIRCDWDQLRDDILLARLCHMNYFRLTQRPVQSEIYDFCDRLGMLTQTDLPLFGVLRRNQFAEAVRQAEEMERLVRPHPCNILVTYMNEPFPHGQGKLHRHLSRPELESFFLAADQAVRLANPDRVIKAVDGDYDPPGPGLPDNHCYCGWYNGHGVDLGRLHKGYWQKVKPGWFYGCGEFGAEGLDPAPLMRARYPASWLPQTPAEEAAWTPDRIIGAQTGRFHYMWFDTQHHLTDWVAASQSHQAWVTRLMAEAFRRDARMVSFAIHLFIDAFPSGWMKAIMDVERQPKPAYFAYREALTPLLANLRSDRWAFWAGEGMVFEAWICNDREEAPVDARLHYQLEVDGRVQLAGRAEAQIPLCSSAFQGFLRLPAPTVAARTPATVRLAIMAADGEILHDTALTVEVFPTLPPYDRRVAGVGASDGTAVRLARALGATIIDWQALRPGDAILVDGAHPEAGERLAEAAAQGATVLLLGLPAGTHTILGERVAVTPCGMNPRHFVSRATGHPLVADLAPADLRFWYDEDAGYVTPLLATAFTAPDWTPILRTGNGDWAGNWAPALAAAERRHGAGVVRICQVALAGRIASNPAAALLARRLLSPISELA